MLLAFLDVWVATLDRRGAELRHRPALALRRQPQRRGGAGAPSRAAAAHLSRPARDPRPIYIAACLSGLTALGAQVVWTRLLTLLFGATVYAFAIILAVFLAGLGIGSAIAAYMLRRGRNPCAASRGRSSR